MPASGAEAKVWGGSSEAIQHHYDAGNDFYKLWLDPTMSYSCALWYGDTPKDDLEAAQINKHRWHIEKAGLSKGGRLLDVGCGWASLIRTYTMMVPADRMSAVGLTLSHAQKLYDDALKLPNVEIREESWADHRPEGPYDGIVSVGAFEHFAKYMSSREEKVRLYHQYFSRCRSWLEKGRYMTLQILTYGTMKPEEQNQFIAHDVFPESELPSVHEVFEAAEGLFEVTDYRNDRMDYARTADLWLRNLQRNRERILEEVGEEIYARYDRYLKYTVIGFLQNKTRLVRLQFQAI